MFIKFMAFTLVGVMGTLVHYSVLFALVEYTGVNPVAASGCGAAAGLIVNYVLNYKLTFKSRKSHVKSFPRFSLVALVGLGLNLALMALFVQEFQLYYMYAQVLVSLFVLIWNFFANSLWTFQADKSCADDLSISEDLQ